MTAQLERLVADSKQLEAYILKITKRGDVNRVKKLNDKKLFLHETIAELKGSQQGA